MVVMPSASASLGLWRCTSRPSQMIDPASGAHSPEIVLIREDLPAPLSPINAVTLPAGMSRFTPLSARTAPNDLEIPRSESSVPFDAGAATAPDPDVESSEMLMLFL